MLAILPILSIALAAASSASAMILPRHRAMHLPVRSVSTPPATYAEGYLEPYETYHLRYWAIGCDHKHNTSFFDSCCHPMLATENLKDNRAPECAPTPAQMSSASSGMPTSTVIPDISGNGPCDESTTTSSPAKTPTHTSSSKSTTSPKPTPKAKLHNPSTSSTSTTTSPKPTTTSGGSSGGLSGSPNKGGFATFFTQNGVAGACGTVHQDSDMIAAIDEKRYGNSGQKSALCGRKVKILNPANGKSVTVTIADDCPTCKNSNSIDLSVSAFTQIATKAQGMVGIEWVFV